MVVFTTPGSAGRIAEAIAARGSAERIGIVTKSGRTVFTTSGSAGAVAASLQADEQATQQQAQVQQAAEQQAAQQVIQQQQVAAQQQQAIVIQAAVRQQTVSRRQRFFAGVKEIAVGETGKRFIGVGIPGVPLPLVTGQQIRTRLQKGRLPSRVAAQFVPTTPLEVGVIGGAAAIFPALPAIVKIPVGVGITGVEIKRAFDPGRLPEERIASGIIGTAAGVGTTLEALPFIKGGIARLSPKFKPVKPQTEGFEAVVGIGGARRIGLIKPGSPARTGATTGVKLPKQSPLVRGGFGVKPGEKSLFVSGDQIVATSQRGLFQAGKDIPLQKEFFVTPQDPFIKIPVARTSRLGLADILKVPKRVRLAFGIPPSPQIGITTTRVGRIETPTQFKIGTGSELEAIKTFGTITDVKRLGVTTIKGQAVDIFGFQIGKATRVSTPSAITPRVPSTTPITRASGELLVGVTGVARPLPSGTIATITTIPSTRLPQPTPTFIPRTIPVAPSVVPTAPTRPTRRPSGGGGITPAFTPPTIPTAPFTPPTSTPITPPLSPPISLPRTPTSPLTSTQISPRLSLPKSPTAGILGFRTRPIRRRRRQRFQVQARRFGTFRTIGFGRTEREALQIGKRFTTRTLAATFRVPKAKTLKLPGFRTKITKGGVLFIEPKRRRLKRGTLEIPEIQLFRREKAKSRTRKKKKGGKK